MDGHGLWWLIWLKPSGMGARLHHALASKSERRKEVKSAASQRGTGDFCWGAGHGSAAWTKRSLVVPGVCATRLAEDEDQVVGIWAVTMVSP